MLTFGGSAVYISVVIYFLGRKPMTETQTELQVRETEELKKAIAKELEKDDEDKQLDHFFDSTDGRKVS
jgi:hypothetical protein